MSETLKVTKEQFIERMLAKALYGYASDKKAFWNLIYEELGDGKFVLLDSEQLEKELGEYKKIDKRSASKLWVEGARWVIEFIEKKLLGASK